MSEKSKLVRMIIWMFVFLVIIGAWMVIAYYDHERGQALANPTAIVLIFVLIKSFYTPKWMQNDH